jgi:threonine dehydrogenase-like Zn-dependent dehydrogenase
MIAITFQGVQSVAVGSVPEPTILDPRDAIIRMTTAGLCGSDLHPYFGREVGLDLGTVMGHELVGIVVDAGSGAREAASPVEIGSRVVAPFSTSCGECAPCRTRLTARCVRGELLGWRAKGMGLHGAQAEFVRVPFADSTLVRVPDAVTDDALAVLAGDILSTALFGAELARVAPGDVVVVLGCGPVGLLTVRAVLAAGARSVIAVDPVRSRLAEAERFGARPLLLGGEDVVRQVHAWGDGIGADAVLEAVGTAEATRLAADVLRPGGRIAAIGVHTELHLALSPGELYDRNLSYAAGRCSARHYLPQALALVEREQELLRGMISHRLPLTDGVAAYREFGARTPGWNKVVFMGLARE